MCLDCHRDLGSAADLINGTIDRHPLQATTTEMQLASEAVHDARVLDKYLAGAPFTPPQL